MTYRWQDHNLPYFPANFKFLWPTGDSSLHGDIPTLAHLDREVFPLIPQKRIAVQAGGAMGMWPKRMSQVFETVYTWEPTPQSFRCLVHNCRDDENVVAFNSALGYDRKMIVMGFPEHPANYGGFRCMDHPQARIPVMRLDDLILPCCDLMMLDLEGYELFALMGAKETINRCKPVIVMEDKGCSRTFGYAQGHVCKWLQTNCQYTTGHRFHGGRDVICLPPGYSRPKNEDCHYG